MNELKAVHPLGILSYSYLNIPAEAMAAEIGRHGFQHVQLDPRQAGIADKDGGFGERRAEEVRLTFERERVSIPVLSGYMNLLDPDLERRERNLLEMERMLELCPVFGASGVATETGSLHPTNPWGDHPANRGEAAWHDLLTAAERLRRKAAANGVTLLLEGYVNNVLAAPRQAADLMKELTGPGLGLVMDPFNYMREPDLERQEEALDDLFGLLAAHSRIVHAKDAVYTAKGIDTPRAGTGRMQWELVAKRLRERLPGVPLFLEHLRPEEVPECLAFLEEAYRRSREI